MTTPTVTRWPNGVCDATQDGAYGNFAGMRPFRYHNDIDDFNDYLAGQWVATLATSATAAIQSADGGILALTNVNAGATDESSLQWAGHSGAFAGTFQFDATKDMLLAAKFAVDDVVNSALLVGIGTVDTTPLASQIANFIGFYKASGAADLIAECRIAGVTTSIDLGNMVNNTYVNCTLFYQASPVPGSNVGGVWRAFLNDILLGSFTAASNTPTGVLAKTIGILNASAVAHALSVDYLQVSKQR